MLIGNAIGLVDRIAQQEVLSAAWSAILDADREDGMLALGVARFAEDAEERTARIVDELADGDYQPNELTPVPLIRPRRCGAAIARAYRPGSGGGAGTTRGAGRTSADASKRSSIPTVTRCTSSANATHVGKR